MYEYIHNNSRPVSVDVLEAIENHFRARLRIAARIGRFKKIDIICVTVYLWDNEGLSLRNIRILQQFHMLPSTLNFPFVAFGDFNMSCEDFEKFEWPEIPKEGGRR